MNRSQSQVLFVPEGKLSCSCEFKVTYPTGVAGRGGIHKTLGEDQEQVAKREPRLVSICFTHSDLAKDAAEIIRLEGKTQPQVSCPPLTSLAKFIAPAGVMPMTAFPTESFLEVINDLEKLGLVSPDHLDFLENCLLNIHRKDLVKKIQKHKLEASAHTIGSSPVYINALQAKLPKLTLIDPPGMGSRVKLLNGSGAIQKGQVSVSVSETGTTMSQAPDCYRMQSRPLGVCLIIDCIGNDTNVLVDAFTSLYFDVHCYQFLNVNSLPQKLHEVARLKQHKDYDCFACVLVSRGNHQDVFCTDRVLPGFALEKVKRFFTGDKCPALLGKPKLFFIQNYIELGHRQEQSSFVEADGDLASAIPQVADILWSQSTVEAPVLERSPASSSFYLSTLAELLTDPHKRMLSLLDILVELNDRIYKRNTDHPTEQYSLLLKHTLRKKVFLSQG
ncbi:CASP8 and FADD-like apoptosis regulator [Sphaerodactylus townsendi]|uniref:CASP8 and FADD-like apoptosis regulator n=1 Tax=Sphaerodactylus townsendi TaxID=933632 RepID=UPI0020270941|nr:CASP8 and FADD-like apoptosis regulator [Sphaerodactylus townsendi]